MPEITLLVLAAGIGRRYRGLKQIEPVGPSGEAILDYAIHDALRSGFRRLVFVIRREIEKAFRQSIGEYWETRVPVYYVYQEMDAGLPAAFSVPAHRHKPWGTAHAVLVSRAVVDTPFAAINADDFYGPTALRVLGRWLQVAPRQSDGVDEYSFVGYPLKNTLSENGYVSRGICTVNGDGYLREVVERVRVEKDGAAAKALDESGRWLSLGGEEVASMNFWGFTPTVFSHLERGFGDFLGRYGRDTSAEYYLPSAVNELIKSGKARVKYIPTSEKWFGMTYPADVPRVRSYIRQLVGEGIYPENLKSDGGNWQ
jgi:dTDP-glucose pyrophosphorylase